MEKGTEGKLCAVVGGKKRRLGLFWMTEKKPCLDLETEKLKLKFEKEEKLRLDAASKRNKRFGRKD